MQSNGVSLPPPTTTTTFTHPAHGFPYFPGPYARQLGLRGSGEAGFSLS